VCIEEMAVTPSIEFDPVFLRALRLLQSRSEDSAHQLRLMLDDCLRQVNQTNVYTKFWLSDFFNTVFIFSPRLLTAFREKAQLVRE